MKKTQGMRFADVFAALLGIGFGATAIYMTLQFKAFKNVPVGPEAFPQIMAAGLVICCVSLLIQAVLRKTDTKAPTLSIKDRGIQRMLMSLGVVVAFCLLWETIGFLILAPIALCLLMLLLQYRNYKKMLLIAFIISIAIWLLFWKVLSIELPLGPLGIIY